MDLELPVRFMHNGRELAALRLGSAEDGWTDRTCSLWLSGDLMNVRNVQGGQYVKNPDGSVDKGMLNLDLGAGNSQDRGNIVLNFDVGNNLEVFNGREERIASFRHGEQGDVVRHYGRTFLHRGAYVPKPGGGWRAL